VKYLLRILGLLLFCGGVYFFAVTMYQASLMM